jgi:TRAP-type C4-dicarboxylate transport system permease small subunit
MNGPDDHFLVRWNGRVTLWLARIATVILAVLALMTFTDVFLRYVFNSPLHFTYEITELSMGIIVFFGLGLVTHKEGHISVDILTLRMGDRLRAFFALFTNLAALVYLALLVWRVFLRAGELETGGDLTQILLWPLWPHAYVMAFGSVFLITGAALLAVKALRDVTRGRPPH